MSNNYIANDGVIHEWMNINCNRLSCNELLVRNSTDQYVQIVNKVIANSTALTSLFNDTNAKGSRIIPAGYFSQSAKYLRCLISGVITSTAVPAGLQNLEVRLDNVLVATIIIGTVGFSSNSYFQIDFDLVHVGGGLFKCNGYFRNIYGVSGNSISHPLTTGSNVILVSNYNNAVELDVRANWNIADPLNTLTSTFSIITKY